MFDKHVFARVFRIEREHDADAAARLRTATAPFILRRLKSDRFYTVDFTPRVYTPEGMDWIDHNDMTSVLLRHYPELEPPLRGQRNAFAPWARI